MTDERVQTSPAPAVRRGGFTLTEVLIVVGLMLLVITLAIPAFSVITGGRSVDSAQNVISAALARARQDAMGLQEPRGIIFFTDPNTARTILAEVYYPDYQGGGTVVDLLPDREELELPVGVGCQVMPHGNGGGASPFPTMGLILFDGLGRVAIRQYWIPGTAGRPGDANYNALRARMDPIPAPAPPLGSAGTPLFSQVGVLLYDQSGYTDAPNKTTFLADNATTVLINRYNGTMLPAR